jgi:glycosyltransferase involved in cell wall biosynthesis
LATPAPARLAAIQVVASINEAVGGPARSVSRLAAALCDEGVDSTLATLDYREHGPQCDAGGARVVGVPAGALARNLRGLSPAFLARLRTLAAGADIVHGHGLWMFPNRYAALAAAASNAKLVISPRGMLEEWAVRRSRWRKALAWRFFEQRSFAQAALLHATSDAEAGRLRTLGFRQPIAMIANGVDAARVPPPPRAALEARFPALAGKRWLLYLARLHPKKGALELVEAWSRLPESARAGWHLVLAGPDLDGYGVHVARAVEDHALQASVTLTGMLAGDAKDAALAHASLFVLPTRSENFGIAVAEALAHGVPVITTRAAPWPQLESEGCGWWIGLEDEALQRALREALERDAATLAAMGARGRDRLAGRYAWGQAARDMKAAYLWIAGRGERPACVALA